MALALVMDVVVSVTKEMPSAKTHSFEPKQRIMPLVLGPTWLHSITSVTNLGYRDTPMPCVGITEIKVY